MASERAADRNAVALLKQENFDLKLKLKEMAEAGLHRPASGGEASAGDGARGDEKLAQAREIISRLKTELEQVKSQLDEELSSKRALERELAQSREESSRLISANADKLATLEAELAHQKHINRTPDLEPNQASSSSSSSSTLMLSSELAKAREDLRALREQGGGNGLRARDDDAVPPPPPQQQQQQQQLKQLKEDNARLKSIAAQVDPLRQRVVELEASQVEWRTRLEEAARRPSTAQVLAVERALQTASDRLETLERDHHLKTLALRKRCEELELRNRELVSQIRDLNGRRLSSPLSASPRGSNLASGMLNAGATSSSSPSPREALSPREGLSPTWRDSAATPQRLEALHRHAVRRLDLVDMDLASATERLSKAV